MNLDPLNLRPVDKAAVRSNAVDLLLIYCLLLVLLFVGVLLVVVFVMQYLLVAFLQSS